MREVAIAYQREQDDDTQQAAAPPAREQPAARRPAEDPKPVTKAALADPVMSRIFDFG
jgi:hypothetical protein